MQSISIYYRPHQGLEKQGLALPPSPTPKPRTGTPEDKETLLVAREVSQGHKGRGTRRAGDSAHQEGTAECPAPTAGPQPAEGHSLPKD